MTEIHTDRLILRKAISEQEKISLVSQIGDWEVVKWLANAPYPYTDDDLEDYLLISDSNQFDLNIFMGKQLIGRVGLTLDGDNYYDLGYWIGKDYWGKGYATESSKKLLEYVLDKLDLLKIKSGYFVGNSASGNVLKKLGFKEVGVEKRYSVSNKKEMDLMLVVL